MNRKWPSLLGDALAALITLVAVGFLVWFVLVMLYMFEVVDMPWLPIPDDTGEVPPGAPNQPAQVPVRPGAAGGARGGR
ncbi:hypothetical protein QF035_010402 [Streptomyces umbrinus]|uniref:Secreted protein n=1 Tax=Streptomyces umbrinus TaxID=67370 RepID=A0ABU0TAN1_9ACTN|nr:hypothetical protein [Streptomyces umbrinus]MDQ1032820.1 hypothetical protein [Streptomyces umbrinus]